MAVRADFSDARVVMLTTFEGDVGKFSAPSKPAPAVIC